MELSNYELSTINGGKANYALYFGIAAAVTFIIGVIDGFLRPLKCNK